MRGKPYYAKSLEKPGEGGAQLNTNKVKIQGRLRIPQQSIKGEQERVWGKVFGTRGKACPYWNPKGTTAGEEAQVFYL